jgi:hypothetical protein
LKVPFAELAALSFAEQDTVDVPNPNIEPEAGLQLTMTEPSTASNADAVNVTLAPAGSVGFATMSAGRFRTGGVLSSTITAKVPAATLPALSVAEQETVVVPNGNVEPEAGVHENVLTPDKESVALGLYETAAPLGPTASTVSEGDVTVGAVRSIFTVTEAEFDTPAWLVAVQVSVVPPCRVSAVSVVVVHPEDEAIPDSASETDQLTVTVPLFQPLLLALGVTVGEITGGVVSARVKLAVIAPLPRIVAEVDGEDELVKVIDAASLLQPEKA